MLDFYISIHVLREEDDTVSQPSQPNAVVFQSTSSARRTTLPQNLLVRGESVFQSTSSARRTTHPLRGDAQNTAHFNPRPPRGGRPKKWRPILAYPTVFQSTSSARRTTGLIALGGVIALFQSTSSARRTTAFVCCSLRRNRISIHVLREEDDKIARNILASSKEFQSTSSARRTTGN